MASSSTGPTRTASRHAYSTSININLLRPNIKHYEIDQEADIATNVSLAYYRLSDEEKPKMTKKKADKHPISDRCVMKVVIKRFKLDNLDESDYQLVEHEAKTLKQLKNPYIVPLVSNFVADDQLWFVMPAAEFGSLYSWSRPFGLEETGIALALRDVLNGVAYLHSVGIIHRGIRSSRILVNKDGRCMLTGLRHSINCVSNGEFSPIQHEYPADAQDNINWFSPEILEQNLCGYNYKTDIYSIGITACELANGIVPFDPISPTEMLLDKLTGRQPRLLDKTCSELADMNIDQMTLHNQVRFKTYRSRRFTDNFHNFLTDCCLATDPSKRSTVSNMLKHKFFNQIKKRSNLTDYLTVKRPLRPLPEVVAVEEGKLSPAPSRENILEHLKANLCAHSCLSCEHCRFSGYIDKNYCLPTILITRQHDDFNWEF